MNKTDSRPARETHGCAICRKMAHFFFESPVMEVGHFGGGHYLFHCTTCNALWEQTLRVNVPISEIEARSICPSAFTATGEVRKKAKYTPLKRTHHTFLLANQVPEIRSLTKIQREYVLLDFEIYRRQFRPSQIGRLLLSSIIGAEILVFAVGYLLRGRIVGSISAALLAFLLVVLVFNGLNQYTLLQRLRFFVRTDFAKATFEFARNCESFHQKREAQINCLLP